MGTLFPNKTRIPNAYTIVDNSEHLLADGWGIKVGSSTPSPLEFGQYSNIREFTIVFSREVRKLRQSYTEDDTAVKALLEDINTVQKDFYNVDEIGIGGDITNIELGPTSSINDIYGERSNFKDVEVSFLFQITEDL